MKITREKHASYMAKVSPLRLQREVLYREVVAVAVKRPGRPFSDVVLELKTGETVRLHHVDDPARIERVIAGRRG